MFFRVLNHLNIFSKVLNHLNIDSSVPNHLDTDSTALNHPNINSRAFGHMNTAPRRPITGLWTVECKKRLDIHEILQHGRTWPRRSAFINESHVVGLSRATFTGDDKKTGVTHRNSNAFNSFALRSNSRRPLNRLHTCDVTNRHYKVFGLHRNSVLDPSTAS
jgi:hypothetical protein